MHLSYACQKYVWEIAVDVRALAAWPYVTTPEEQAPDCTHETATLEELPVNDKLQENA